jgi:hypothetical protein
MHLMQVDCWLTQGPCKDNVQVLDAENTQKNRLQKDSDESCNIRDIKEVASSIFQAVSFHDSFIPVRNSAALLRKKEQEND